MDAPFGQRRKAWQQAADSIRRMYTPSKRRRTDMLLGAPQQPLAPAPPADGQRPTSGDCAADPRDELRRLALEVEPVVLPRAFSPTAQGSAAATHGASSPLSPTAASDPPPVIGYQPTYRAVLAKRQPAGN